MARHLFIAAFAAWALVGLVLPDGMLECQERQSFDTCHTVLHR
ncbi:hypothetical protein MAXJ12_08654 [Mesorhizobium alhagi CCNWXJ12-2]|uniref:Uncharacterized protein n=1 Tax=Mesorhizobium alhagi CCNWXJ12-2 TaxID=1107882 RepID=H0HNK8_9HYPH|nr:hypothetical protein MAXJ12_08654 [Mesorhizobium alhagi CCNWXJ12-2]